MNKALSIFFFLLVLSACSDDDKFGPGTKPPPDPNPDDGKEETENPYKTDIDLSSSAFVGWDNKHMEESYFMLGYGYDATGKYAHPVSVRNKVIDIEKFDEDYNDVTLFMATSGGPELQVAGTQKECRETMAERAGFSTSEIIKYKNLFKGAFESSFENDTSFPGLSYSYWGISQLYVKYHVYFLYMSHMQERFQSKYLNDQFKADLETKSPEEIIKRYGTHVLNSIKIGERIDYLYRYAEDKNSNSYEWFLYNMHRYFSQGPSIGGSKPQNNAPLKENIRIEAVDGTLPDPNTWMVDITNYKGEIIQFDAWNRITDANLTFAEFRGNNCLIPIYEFVKNPDKKAELIRVIEKYLGKD